MTATEPTKTCAHTGGLSQEYVFDQRTGDYACNDCGLAISPAMWAELRRKSSRVTHAKRPSISMTCPVCAAGLHSQSSDFRGEAREMLFCLTCGYEARHVWRSVS